MNIPECEVCDFENAKKIGRATWHCPICGRDFSIEYLFWHQAAYPEQWENEHAVEVIRKI